MYLKKIEIYGFKSFADRIEIKLDEGITGIVGPNGSGKSNISDALRWVLGEQSARQLRGNRMEDIIFGGTQQRRRLSYCEVELTFDNSDAMLPVDYREVTVTRRVFRTGKSEYYINKNSCRLKDIVDLFHDTGIGKEGYSIVGQGSISEILSSKPEERRQIFQEAAGITKYRVRCEEAQTRLARTRDNMLRLRDIMEEIGANLEPLRIQSHNARTFLALSEQLKDLELTRFVAVHDTLRQRMEDMQTRLAASQELIEDYQGQLSDMKNHSELLAAEAEQCEEAISHFVQQAMELQAAIGNYTGERNTLLERIQRMNAENLRLEEEAVREEERSGKLQAEAAERKDQISGGVKEAEILELQLAQLNTQLEKMDEVITEQEQDLDARKELVLDRITNLSVIKSSEARLTAVKQSLADRVLKIEQETAAAQQEAEYCREAEEEIIRHLDAVTGAYEQTAHQRDDAQQQVAALRSRLEGMTESREDARRQMQALRTRVQMLTSMKRDYEGYASSIKNLMNDAAHDPSIRRLIMGVIAELIEVPAKYVKALEVTLAGAMQNIVTRNEEDAKALIEHMRSNRYGRGTFLPLTAIRGRSLTQDERRVLTMSGCLGSAADVITCDDRYRDIVSNLLSRTIIAERMDDAIAMARACRHTLRIVTLEGDIINAGGSMTGGSTNSRVTSILGREQELEDGRSKISLLEKKLNTFQDDIQRDSQKLSEAVTQMEKLASELHDIDIELAREKERLTKAEQNKQGYLDRVRVLEEEKQSIAQTMSDVEGELTGNDNRIVQAEQESKQMRELLITMQQRLGEQRDEREELSQQIAAMQSDLAVAKRDEHLGSSQVERLLTDAKALKSSAEARRTAIGDNHKSIEAMGLQEQNISGQIDASQAQLEQIQIQRSTAEKKRAELRRSAWEQDSRYKEVSEARQETVQECNRLEVAYAKQNSDMENLLARIWDTYEVTIGNIRQEYEQAEFDVRKADQTITSIRSQIRALGNVNVAAIEDYEKQSQRYEEYLKQRTDLEKGESDLLAIIEELNTQMKKQYLQQFEILATHFEETFVKLFGGGTAQISLENPEDALASGIDIAVQPPGKKLQLLSLLSGGEKALTATAILFAMLKLRPSPFCVLDEVEAALDEANVKNFADYLREYARETQFIVVTHRKGTMEAADRLYGVTMEDKGVSKIVGVQISDIAI